MWLAHTNRMLLVGFVFVSWAAGQETPAVPGATSPESQPAQQAPQDPLGRTTPYGAVVGFMRAFQNGEFARSAEYLDSKGTDSKKQQLAEQLGRVLNEGMTLEIRSLSRDPSGHLEDNLRKNRELVGVATVGSHSLNIYLDVIERLDDPPIWLFSPETLAGIPDFAEQLEGPWQEKHLPRFLIENDFLSVQLYRWIAVPLLLLLLYLGTKFLAWLLTLVLRRLVDLLSGHRGDRKITFSGTGPLWLLLFALAMGFLADLGVTALARYLWGTVAAILIVFAVVWLLVRLIRTAMAAAAARMEHRNAPEKIALVSLAGRVMQILVGLSAILVVLHIVGVELTGILAGLGLGGVALALGAQKTLENFLGGVMVIGDAPIRVGDFCRVGEYVGIIEDIGLRSTRMRTADRTLVYIPNGELSALSLENLTGRDKIRFLHILGLQRETTVQQLRCILDESQKMLLTQPKVESGSARVRFTKVGDSSLDIEVLAYVLETNFPAFLEVQQDLLLRILDIVESCGTSLALPSQMTYLVGNSDQPSAAEIQQKESDVGEQQG